MKEKRERRLSNQLATYIPEWILFVLGIAFVGLIAYNFIPGHNYLRQMTSFGIKGELVNFVLLVLSCSIALAAGVALLVVSIVGRYKDMILWPHHVAFITSFVFMTCGIVFLAVALLV